MPTELGRSSVGLKYRRSSVRSRWWARGSGERGGVRAEKARPRGQPPGPPSLATYPRPHSSSWTRGAAERSPPSQGGDAGSIPVGSTHRGGTPDRNARGQGQCRAPPGVRATNEPRDTRRPARRRRWHPGSPCGCSSAGRAPGFHPGCRRFDSGRPLKVPRHGAARRRLPAAALRSAATPGGPGVAPRARAEVAAPGTSAPSAPSGLGCWQARRGFGPRYRRGFDSCTRSEGRVRMARSAGGSSPVMAKTVNRARGYAALPLGGGGASATAERTP